LQPHEFATLGKPAQLREQRAPFGIFEGVRDDYLLKPLRHHSVRRTKFNHGGSSLSLRLDFEGGGRAAFKPEQINLQTVPRKEVAAYRLDRLLGIGAVPPAVPRAFPRSELAAHVDVDARGELPRLDREARVNPDGSVVGELSWWIPELVSVEIDGVLIDLPPGMALWKRYLTAGAPIPAEDHRLLKQISTMVAFDFVTNNVDRWSGSNAKGSPDGRKVYFMDNTLAFGTEPDGHPKSQEYLSRVEKFSLAFYLALRALRESDFRREMTTDTGPYAALLNEAEIQALLSRRQLLLANIEALIQRHGEKTVLAFP